VTHFYLLIVLPGASAPREEGAIKVGGAHLVGAQLLLTGIACRLANAMQVDTLAVSDMYAYKICKFFNPFQQ